MKKIIKFTWKEFHIQVPKLFLLYFVIFNIIFAMRIILSRNTYNIPRLIWENCVKRNVKMIDPGANWREVSAGRERRRRICFTGWT